ncbi:MAG TPA: S8 family serine peptidase [Lentimicrobium sp.]|nr:S8 family serine peptidase [Lentimicrobium sp.]
MRKIIFLCQSILCFWLLNVAGYAQEYETGVFRIWLINDEIRFNDNQSTNNELNIIMAKYGVTSIEQSFPWANKPENRRFYTIRFTGDDNAFINELRAEANHLIYPPYRFVISTPLYEPSDVLFDSIWHLKKIQADSAWEIERGNKDTKIAIIDTYYDPDHPDLSSQLLYNYDPCEPDTVYDAHYAMSALLWHGTTVAGFAAGQTTNSGEQQPEGADYAAIGFNNKIIPFVKNDVLGKALFASTRMHADVISYSAIGTCSMSDSAILQAQSIIEEILDNGTVIVAGAGNGFCNGCYKNTSGEIEMIGGCQDPGDFVEFTTPYPFSPLIDSRII